MNPEPRPCITRAIVTARLDGPSTPGQRRGHHHACDRIMLVKHSERLASARAAVCASGGKHVERAVRGLQPNRVALPDQRERLEGPLTEVEDRLRLPALDRSERQEIPVPATQKTLK